MNEEIKDNPSLKKLREDVEELRAFKKVWPLCKPFARLLGVNTTSVDEILSELTQLEKKTDEMAAIPDKFNDLFSDRGWILFDSMSLDTAKQAIEIAESEGLDQADEFLVDYFSPEWVEDRINWLRNITGFRERFCLAKKALEDYRAGRFYASVLVTLSLIDGWVSELNIVDFQRHGFFAEKSQLIAWDSIAAHPKGLVKLQAVFGKSRMMTRSEEIRIPYRHGIIHGMDLGYDNKYVAAKCWAALFAVRDWAIKAAKGELSAPEIEPEVEKTLWESIESYLDTQREIERIKQWQPRQVIVGESIPAAGQIQDYPSNTPERKIVEFLSYWMKNNYGYMARCHAPMLKTKPVEVKVRFQDRQLLEFELVEVNDVTPAVTDIRVRLKMRINNQVSTPVYEFRVIANDQDGDLAYVQDADTVWGITIWRNPL